MSSSILEPTRQSLCSPFLTRLRNRASIITRMPPIRKTIVPILLALAIATLTAACGCGSARAATVASGAPADPHACCHPERSTHSNTPAPQHEQCFHCQRTLAVETSAKVIPPLTLALIGIGSDPVAVVTTQPVVVEHLGTTNSVASANSLLRQHCALVL